MTKTKKTLFLADPGTGYWKGVDRLISPSVGNFLEPDGWSFGELLSESDWDAADFRVCGNGHDPSGYAIKLEITGRDLRYRHGSLNWVRVRIVWVGDGEPDTFSGGWLKTDGYEETLASAPR